MRLFNYINTVNYICEENDFTQINLIELNALILLTNAYSMYAFRRPVLEISFEKPAFGAIYSKSIAQYFESTSEIKIPQAYCNRLLTVDDFTNKDQYETVISRLQIFINYIKDTGLSDLTQSLRRLDCDRLTNQELCRWYRFVWRKQMRQYRNTLPINLAATSAIVVSR